MCSGYLTVTSGNEAVPVSNAIGNPYRRMVFLEIIHGTLCNIKVRLLDIIDQKG